MQLIHAQNIGDELLMLHQTVWCNRPRPTSGIVIITS